MSKVDLFESAFRSADKPAFVRAPLTMARILVVTDLDTAASGALLGQVRGYLNAIDGGQIHWAVLDTNGYDNVKNLLEHVEAEKPDLIVTYRHLKSSAWKWPFSLGEYLDVLTQTTTIPVLVLPHPDAAHALPHSVRNTDNVMAITDHLSGDNAIVNVAASFTADGGTCWLSHVESGQIYERYMDVISRIPEIDTQTAREAIGEQLLKEPRDFIARARTALEAEGHAIKVEAIVTMGRRIDEYRHLIEAHEIDLLILHTKDDEQLAMHGTAYPLAVEMRQIPLLML